MLDVLQAFNLPPDVLNAVRTLYNGPLTSVKVNGHHRIGGSVICHPQVAYDTGVI